MLHQLLVLGGVRNKKSSLHVCQIMLHYFAICGTSNISMICCFILIIKSKVIPRHVEVALGVPDRLRPWTFSTFGTTRVVGRYPNEPAAFTPGEIPGTHFQRLSRHGFVGRNHRKNPK